MYIYDRIFEESFYSAQSFDFYYKDSDSMDFENGKVGVFDIETTGLDPRNGQVVMGAILHAVPGGLRVRQFFTEDEGEEEELLILYKEALDEMDVLVSYNGNGFDFPYLRYRLKRHGLDSSFAKILSLDMFAVLNKHSNFRQIIPNLKQVTVEEYLGLREDRKDTIDGGKSVELFFRYLENKSEELRDIMLLHNRDDVLQLSRILWAFDNLNIHKIAAHTGFPIIEGEGDSRKKFLVTGIKIKTKRLDVKGRYAGISGRYNIFRDDSTINLEPSEERNLIDPESNYGNFEMSIPLRYEEKTTFAVKGDLDIDENFWTKVGMNNGDYVILKRDGEPEYLAINLLVKYIVRDIIVKI